MEKFKKPVLITGGCGFVGRHLVKELLTLGNDIWIIDDLSVGQHPDIWLNGKIINSENRKITYQINSNTVTFINQDSLKFLYDMVIAMNASELPDFGDIFHLASIVGGRSLIDGDPMRVATDLGIDAIFFLWATRFPKKMERILYASSSAAYPTQLQVDGVYTNLTEEMIQFNSSNLGQPDMTYGWSKLTGEYLSTIAAKHYGLHVACIRPFSGYGEDQDLSYPIPSIALRVAKQENPLIVWGTGEQARDFVYIDDCIKAMFFVLDHVSDGSGVNIGTGKLTTFNQICKKFAELEGYTPIIEPQIDKPVGVHNRYCDPKLIYSLGWKPEYSIEEGLSRVLAGAHERVKAVQL